MSHAGSPHDTTGICLIVTLISPIAYHFLILSLKLNFTKFNIIFSKTMGMSGIQ